MLVEVQESRDDFVLAVRVDLAVSCPQISSQRKHLRLAGQGDPELLGDGGFELGTIEFRDHILDGCGSIHRIQWKRPTRVDRRKGRVHCFDALGPQKPEHNDISERRRLKPGRPKFRKIEMTHDSFPTAPPWAPRRMSRTS